jgi:hypothetical protein
MKRTVIILSLIFALAIALSASIPTLALQTDTGTTTITGTIKGNIDITANSASATITGMDPGVPKDSSVVSVTVKSNKAGWTLDVEENGVTPDGKMAGTLTPFPALTNELYVKGGDIAIAESILGAPQLVESGAKSVANTIGDIYFVQTADWLDDAALTYTITVVFTATVAE